MRNQRGQSLIETIIALSIIVSGLGGAVTLVTYSLRSSESTLNRLIAQNLAAESIEVVTNIRDSNYLAGDAFNAALDGGPDGTAIAVFDEATNTWTIDFAPNAFTEPTTTLYQQGGVYRQSSASIAGTATPFKRLITLDNSNADEIHVTAEVQWSERGQVKRMGMERTLYNWR